MVNRTNQQQKGKDVDPSHVAWSKFFDKHSLIGSSTTAQPLNTNRFQESPFPNKSPPVTNAGRFSSFGFGTGNRPRKSRSARDLASSSLETNNNKQKDPRSIGIGASAGRYGKQAGLSETEWDEMMKKLRRMVLLEGVPNDDFRVSGTRSTARSTIWKLLLDCREVDAALYLSLVAQGPSPMHDKIRNDTSRTLTTDQMFQDRVDESALIRMLDAFVWRYWNQDEEEPKEVKKKETGGEKSFTFSYVQGMNVLAAPFLFVMGSELEAFHCFCNFIENCCPTYVQPTLIGVHRGLQLLERCLQMADPALSNHLRTMKLNAELYAFPSVLTLCACTPPLLQVLQVWDYLLAFGTHLAIPCIVAQLLLIRDEIINSTQPMKLLRQFPDLDARSIVGIATTLVRDLDDSLYDELVQHTITL